MKIGVISNLYPPVERGGAERVVRRIVDELRKRGHDVFVVTTIPFHNKESYGLKQSMSEVERVYRFYPRNLYHTLRDHQYIFPLRVVWHLIDLFCRCSPGRIEKMLLEEKPDIILTHNLKGIGLRVPEMLQKNKIPFIHTLHDVQLSIPSGLIIYNEKNWLNRSFLRSWYERWVKKFFGKPNRVISPSKFLADFYKERGFFKKQEIDILQNPAPHFTLPDRGERQPGPLRLLFVGQLEKHKGILLLLDALDQVKAPVELHIAGEGKLKEYLSERMTRDRKVTYHGYVSTEQLQQLFMMTDSIVVPSLCYENSPTVIYESLQSGVPAIVADAGGAAELIQNGENGYIVEPGNQQALTRAIERMAEEAERFRHKDRQIRESIAPYHIEQYIEKLENIIKEVIKNPGS